MKKRIFISACEPSAEMHCANLMDAINQQCNPDKDQIEWIGLGGTEMQKHGCNLLENTVARAAMIYNAFGQVGYYVKLVRRIGAYFKANKVDLVIVCDSPAFHFHIAKAAKNAGIKVLWYVAPQLWAWAPWRLGKLKKRTDRLACILPFEQNWFSSRGMEATFVGNPLFDELPPAQYRQNRFSEFDSQNATVALMSGSRDAEIKTLWQPMQQIAMKIAEKLPGVTFTAVGVNDQKLAMLKDTKLENFQCDFTLSNVFDTAFSCDLTLVASGSATLQVAAAGCPMVVMYRSNRLLWHILGRWLIRTPYLSLVNIVAKRQVVREFMPYFRSTEPIFAYCMELLCHPEQLAKISSDLLEITAPLGKENASKNAATMAMELLKEQ